MTSLKTALPFIDLVSQKNRIKEKLDNAWARVLSHGHYILGPEVFELETQLEKFAKVPHVISCANGTDALFMVLMAYDIGPGDAVFVPSFTFAATAEVVALRGATPIFVDVKEDTFTICSHSLEESIHFVETKTSLKAKAIIPVDLFGQPADHTAIEALASAYNLIVIVDAAQSAGALYKGESTLTYGDVATTSFFPAKPLGCYGDGGAIFTKDPEIAAVLKSIRVHGQGETRYQNIRLGVTGRLDTLQAAILLEKLAIFPDEIVARQRVADRYEEGLKDSVRTPILSKDRTSVWAQYTLQVKNRDLLQKELAEKGIPTMIYYPEPLHTQKPYQGFPVAPSGLPTTERLAQTVLSLPMHAYLQEQDQDYIIEHVQHALQRVARP